jgi:hypothetical protein
MGELVLLVVAAAWASVLIPPLLRSRIENRPNSSITDFRRKLNRLENTVPPRAVGGVRGPSRGLVQSPLHRPAASGRPGLQPVQARRSGSRTHGMRTATIAPAREPAPRRREPAPRRRSHADPTGGQQRPQQAGRTPQQRQAQMVQRSASSDDHLRRRRSNVTVMLVVTACSTLFLAATTQEPAMLYVFAVTFLALCGYLYMLASARQRESSSWPNDWMDHR